MCEANFCKIQSSKQSLTPKHQFFNVTILQIKGFNKTCFCKHMDKIYEIGVLSIYWKTFSIHCSLRETIIALRRVLISKMCISSIICQSAMILYIQCWALIFNLLKSIVIVFFPYETICGIFHSPFIVESEYFVYLPILSKDLKNKSVSNLHSITNLMLVLETHKLSHFVEIVDRIFFDWMHYIAEVVFQQTAMPKAFLIFKM